MKISIELTDEDVRNAIQDKVYAMLPDEVLDLDDSEVEIDLTVYGVDEDDGPVAFDLSDPDDWQFEVKVVAGSADEVDNADEISIDEDLEEHF